MYGLNKIYVITGESFIIKGNFFNPIEIEKSDADADALEEVVATSSRQQDDNDDDNCPSRKIVKFMQKLTATHPNGATVKVDVFPAKIQPQVISNLTSLMDEQSIPEDVLDITPANQTHNLSIIQIDTTDTTAGNGNGNHGVTTTGYTNNNGTYRVGISPSQQCTSPIHNINNSNDICRAFHKLSEAFERYRHESSSDFIGGRDAPFFPTPCTQQQQQAGSKRKKDSSNKTIIGVDCGSAPGGWTKYLIEKAGCDKVYSIDPGGLDDTLSSLDSVYHLKMTAAKAIPEIRKMIIPNNKDDDDDDDKVALWVSDMCVHDIQTQVDTFLHAHKEGIFQPGAAFLLTIKCNIGHGKDRFDKLAEEEANRLKAAGAYDMNILHLFSNRIGERTIMGYMR